ncbi:hypothetical protein [Embleya sp. NBC_00896]|uniref:hypothetical protein n=1 Tax=Embleya sp. NBC_00896 TaxID=2975961 RepID=UPI0038648CC6|nr:hypothetical protein OG928_34475 [Embleya sp. NBC_00896]
MSARVPRRGQRIDEAVELPRTHIDGARHTSTNSVEEMAVILARHDPPEELRDLAAPVWRALADRPWDLLDVDGQGRVWFRAGRWTLPPWEGSAWWHAR